MHYENSAFGKTGFCKTTIIVKNDPSYEIRPVYERGVFSPQDIKKINKLYGCKTSQLPDIGKIWLQFSLKNCTSVISHWITKLLFEKIKSIDINSLETKYYIAGAPDEGVEEYERVYWKQTLFLSFFSVKPGTGNPDPNSKS